MVANKSELLLINNSLVMIERILKRMLTIRFFPLMLFNKALKWLRRVKWERLRLMLNLGTGRWEVTFKVKIKLYSTNNLTSTLVMSTIWLTKNKKKLTVKMMMEKNKSSNLNPLKRRLEFLASLVIRLVPNYTRHQGWTRTTLRNEATISEFP